jgi:hypothetical protein
MGVKWFGIVAFTECFIEEMPRRLVSIISIGPVLAAFLDLKKNLSKVSFIQTFWFKTLKDAAENSLVCSYFNFLQRWAKDVSTVVEYLSHYTKV